MTHITDTLVPEYDEPFDPMSTIVDPLRLPVLGSNLDDEHLDPLSIGHRTPVETAVDWFFDDHSTDESMEDDLPRLPLSRSDDAPVTLDRLITPPPSTTTTATAIAAGLMGLGLIGALLMLGTSAVAAGAAGLWYANQDAPVPVQMEAPVVVQDVEEAWEAEEAPSPASEQATAVPTSVEETPAAKPVVAPRAEAPVAAPIEPDAQHAATSSRSPFAAPPTGSADEVPMHTVKLITSPPAARILVDGVDQGRTPLKIDLDEGAHTLVFEIGGVRTDMPVQVGQSERLCFTAHQGVFATSDCQ
jgi:hypothetical protein